VQYQAVMAATDGNPALASAAIGDILGIARAFEEFPDERIQKTRGEIVRIAARTTAMVVSTVRLDDAALAAIGAAFARIPDRDPLRRAIEGRISGWLVHARGLPRGVTDLMEKVPSSPSEGMPLRIAAGFHVAAGLHWRDRATMLEFFADELRSIDAIESGFANRDASTAELQTRLQAARLFAMRPATQLAMDTFPEIRLGHFQTLADARAAVLVCAIERHRLAHDGEPPVHLGELAPEWLPHGKIPANPFSGCPLRFRRFWGAYFVHMDTAPDREWVRLEDWWTPFAVGGGDRRHDQQEDTDYFGNPRTWWGGLLVDR